MGVRQISEKSPYVDTVVDFQKISQAVLQDQEEKVTLIIRESI